MSFEGSDAETTGRGTVRADDKELHLANGWLDPDFEETQQDQADDTVNILDEDTGWMA